MPDTPSPPPGQESLEKGAKLARAEARAAKVTARQAKLMAQQRKLEARLAKVSAKEQKVNIRAARAAEDIELAAKGYKRGWFGRIVPVKASRRARAHTRRITELHSRTEPPAGALVERKEQ